MPPYRFGRDPITKALEAKVRVPESALALLLELRGLHGASSSSFVEGLPPVDRGHLDRDVFLEGTDDVEHGTRRHDLYRDAIVAALELAFGVDKGGTPEKDAPIAPIDVYWGCGQPFDQAWIGWNGDTDDQRRVTLLLFADTPAGGWDETAVDPVPEFPKKVASSGLVVLYSSGDEIQVKRRITD
jgi:hypothetical protein